MSDSLEIVDFRLHTSATESTIVPDGSRHSTQNLKVRQLKQEYEKPQFKKAAVTLQAVTARANATGTNFDNPPNPG
jgi:hypothetical protein